MLARFSRVVFEACRYSAIGLTLVTVYLWSTMGERVWTFGPGPDHGIAYLAAVPAVLLFCLGWAVLYVVTGETLMDELPPKKEWEKWAGGAVMGLIVGVTIGMAG